MFHLMVNGTYWNSERKIYGLCVNLVKSQLISHAEIKILSGTSVKFRTGCRASGCHFCLWLFPALHFSTLKILHLASKVLNLCADFLSRGYSLYLPKHQPSKSLKWNLPCESDLILSNTNQEQFILPLALHLPLCLSDCQCLNQIQDWHTENNFANS